MSTKETVQGSCIWGSCVVVVAMLLRPMSPVGADTLMILATAGAGRASHIPRPKRTGYRRLKKRFFQPRCLT